MKVGILRRFMVVGAAVWYTTISTGAGFLIFDAFAESEKRVVADFPCATHSCGCRTAAQCAATCCCFPIEPGPSCPMHAAAPAQDHEIVVRVTALSASQCGGSTDEGNASSGLRALDQEAAVVLSSLPAESMRQWAPISDESLFSRVPDVPDKVPISIS
jgi:hypothetical protein